jgi:hypothetical protein
MIASVKTMDGKLLKKLKLKIKIKIKTMTKRLIRNLKSWLSYSVICYILLIPFQIWITSISISLLIGFLFGLLNDIIIQLRKLNGEKFDDIEN